VVSKHEDDRRPPPAEARERDPRVERGGGGPGAQLRRTPAHGNPRPPTPARGGPLVQLQSKRSILMAAVAAPESEAPAPERPARPLRVTLRRARAEDVELVWEWSFAAELRAAMQAPRVVLYKDYERWFAGRIADRLTAIWIVEDAGANAVVVLIDRHDKQALPRLTIVLGHRARGRGIGRRALELACEQWQHPLVADVGGGNDAAVACLEAAGFERTSERQVGSELRCSYLWSP
jgi:RimJ/RimL family protein N-acetyltransferase